MGDRGRVQRFRMALGCSLGFVVAALGGGCGEDDPSASELKERLVPAEQVGFEVEREFEWDNATDFVAEGMYTSEGTTPSELIGPIEDAGFAAAAGETLTDEDGEGFAFLSAVAFDSESGAAAALDTIHGEDLKQPCIAACVVTPTEHAVDGIPNSAAVHHAPSEGKPPPGVHPVEAYHVEFTIGSDLYLFQVSGPPGLSEEDFERNAKAVYEYAAAHD